MSKLTYTKAQRRLICEAFKAAKPYLAHTVQEYHNCGKQMGICYAMFRSGGPGRYLAWNVIEDRLKGHDTVDAWLHANVINARRALNRRGYEARTELIQEYRHRWLDALIEEFSK